MPVSPETINYINNPAYADQVDVKLNQAVGEVTIAGSYVASLQERKAPTAELKSAQGLLTKAVTRYNKYSSVISASGPINDRLQQVIEERNQTRRRELGLKYLLPPEPEDTDIPVPGAPTKHGQTTPKPGEPTPNPADS